MQSSPRLKQNFAVIILTSLVIMGSLVGSANAQGQAAGQTPTPASPVDVAKAQPATPDTPPQRVADIRPDAYIIGAEDQLSINVWKEPEMSRAVPVRPDGMISLPLLGDIKAVGYTPLQLQDQITIQLKKLISDPQVTVMVTEVHSLTFNIVGEVQRPGYYQLTRRMTVLDAIALSGGFKDFAKTKKVYVLRAGPNGTQERLPFNYKDVIKGKNPQQNIDLQPRDTVVVP